MSFQNATKDLNISKQYCALAIVGKKDVELTRNTPRMHGVLQVSGGASIGMNIRVGGDLLTLGNIDGQVINADKVSVRTVETAVITERIVSDGVSFTGDLIPSESLDYNLGTNDRKWGKIYSGGIISDGDVLVNGQLVVLGNTTSVDVKHILVNKNMFVLNANTMTANVDAGFVVERYQNANDLGTGDVVNSSPKEVGTVVNATSSTVVLEVPEARPDNYYQGWFIKIVSGNGKNQVRQISSFSGSSNTAYLSSNWSFIPNSSNDYELYSCNYTGLVWNETEDKWLLGCSSTKNPTKFKVSELADLTVNKLESVTASFSGDVVVLGTLYDANGNIIGDIDKGFVGKATSNLVMNSFSIKDVQGIFTNKLGGNNGNLIVTSDINLSNGLIVGVNEIHSTNGDIDNLKTNQIKAKVGNTISCDNSLQITGTLKTDNIVSDTENQITLNQIYVEGNTTTDLLVTNVIKNDSSISVESFLRLKNDLIVEGSSNFQGNVNVDTISASHLVVSNVYGGSPINFNDPIVAKSGVSGNVSGAELTGSTIFVKNLAPLLESSTINLGSTPYVDTTIVFDSTRTQLATQIAPVFYQGFVVNKTTLLNRIEFGGGATITPDTNVPVTFYISEGFVGVGEDVVLGSFTIDSGWHPSQGMNWLENGFQITLEAGVEYTFSMQVGNPDYRLRIGRTNITAEELALGLNHNNYQGIDYIHRIKIFGNNNLLKPVDAINWYGNVNNVNGDIVFVTPSKIIFEYGNVTIGDSVTTTNGFTNSISLGNGAEATDDNQLTLGGGSGLITTIRAGTSSITNISDVRDKTDISDLTLGIDWIKQIRPVQFYWDRREWYSSGVSDGSKKAKEPSMGLIAQEVRNTLKATNTEWTGMVLESDPERLEVASHEVLMPLVKAFQESLKIIENQQQQINKLKTKIKKLSNLMLRNL